MFCKTNIKLLKLIKKINFIKFDDIQLNSTFYNTVYTFLTNTVSKNNNSYQYSSKFLLICSTYEYIPFLNLLNNYQTKFLVSFTDILLNRNNG